MFRTASRRPCQPALSVHEDSGCLRITWAGASIGSAATLEIIDGGRYASVPISPALSSATYQPLTGDVQIRLGADATWFVGARVSTAASRIEELENEAESLTAESAVRTRRIGELEKAIAKLGSLSGAGAPHPLRQRLEPISSWKRSPPATPSPAAETKPK